MYKLVGRIAVCCMMTVLSAHAAVPYTFSAGNPISASQMNTNFSSVVSSQWTTSSSSQIYYPGAVGIGTSAPAAEFALNVNGYIGATSPWTMSTVPPVSIVSYTVRSVMYYTGLAVSITSSGVYLISYNVRFMDGCSDTYGVVGIAITSGVPATGTTPVYSTISVLSNNNGLLNMSQQTVSGTTIQYVAAGKLITVGIRAEGGGGTCGFNIGGDINGWSSLTAVRIGNNLTPP